MRRYSLKRSSAASVLVAWLAGRARPCCGAALLSLKRRLFLWRGGSLRISAALAPALLFWRHVARASCYGARQRRRGQQARHLCKDAELVARERLTDGFLRGGFGAHGLATALMTEACGGIRRIPEREEMIGVPRISSTTSMRPAAHTSPGRKWSASSGRRGRRPLAIGAVLLRMPLSRRRPSPVRKSMIPPGCAAMPTGPDLARRGALSRAGDDSR